jgi:hypothetical protein
MAYPCGGIANKNSYSGFGLTDPEQLEADLDRMIDQLRLLPTETPTAKLATGSRGWRRLTASVRGSSTPTVRAC